MTQVRLPCATCPWRIDAHADKIPTFSLELAEGLVATTGREIGAPIFACRQSKVGGEVVCAGWLARYGWDNIGVRLGLMQGRYTAEQLNAAELAEWPVTHETFAEVIEKLREDCQ